MRLTFPASSAFLAAVTTGPSRESQWGGIIYFLLSSSRTVARNLIFVSFFSLTLSDRIHMNDTESCVHVRVNSLLHLLGNLIGLLNRRAARNLDVQSGVDNIRPDILGP